MGCDCSLFIIFDFKMKVIFILLFIIATKQGAAQIYSYKVEAIVNRIDVRCMECCDGGTDVAYCEDIRNIKLDSVLNVVYKELKKEMDSASFGKIKIEQREWLKKRNANNKSNASKVNKDDVAERASVVMEDSNFIEQRLVYLSKKLK